MRTNLAENIANNYASQSEEIVYRVKNGEAELRESLINTYRYYIASIVSKITGSHSTSSDEYSVALQAFNEAIDCYNSSLNTSFINFCKLVINRRVIDYIRKNSKFNNEYPFTYYEAMYKENFIDNLSMEQPGIFTEKIEIEEEIIEFKRKLRDFGITLEDLVSLAPKHLDSKLLCISIAKKLVSSNELKTKIFEEKKLPISYLLTQFKLNRKTLEKHRKYIIALFLVMTSDMEIIKSYVNFIGKGV